MEAGAMDLPSIVTDINGSREIIEDGVNGLIVPPKDKDALLSAMTKVLYDRELLSFMKSNSRSMIESRFEQSFVQKCLLDFYDEIM
jgi:glycosyltransferase involved in cell wall biosynthesis